MKNEKDDSIFYTPKVESFSEKDVYQQLLVLTHQNTKKANERAMMLLHKGKRRNKYKVASDTNQMLKKISNRKVRYNKSDSLPMRGSGFKKF